MRFEPAKILPMVAACAAIAERSMKAKAIAVQKRACERFGATDGETTLVSARFDVADDWVLVPASKLLSALKSINSAEADWELWAGSVVITAKGVGYSLPIMPKGDFPPLDAIGSEDPESRKRYGVQAAPLIEAIETVSPCVATQSAKYTMMGVCLELGQVVATDGRRLAVCKYPVEGVQAFSAVIPAKLGPILRGIFGDAEETMTLSIGTNMVHFFGSEAILSTRQIEGKYPDWSAIMPRIIAHKVTTSTADLIEAIQRVGFMAGEEKRVNFTLGQGQLTLTAKTPIDGEAFASMDFPWDGEPMEISLNAAYLLPLLKGIKGEAFTLGINSPGKPIVLQAEGFQGLLMPMS